MAKIVQLYGMLISKNNRKNFILFFLSMSIVCLIFSKFVLSSCLIALIIILLFLQEKDNGFTIGINKAIFTLPKSTPKLWPFTGFILYFLWILFSILWSSNTGAWFHDAVGKFGIIAISFIFIYLPRLSPKEVQFLHHVLYAVLFIAISFILLVYIPQYDDITLRIGRGRPIPTPIDHVRFSMIVAYASLSCFAFISEKHTNPSSFFNSKFVYILLGLFFFVICHILAVRTGIMLLYIGTILLVLFYIINNKKYILGTIALISIILLPIIAYNTIESFRNKVWYTEHDIHQLINNDGVNYSDGDRLRSISNGIELWKDSFILGLGGGDYKQASKQYYVDNNQSGKVLLPHNQFIRAGLAYGIIGLLLLLSGFLFAFFTNKGYKNIFLILILSTFFFSLLVESNMERYYALVFFFLFIGINSHYKNSEKTLLKET